MFRLRDLLLATILFLALSPLFILIIFVLLLSQKRIFFIQKRTGKDLQPFSLIKFSTLHDRGDQEVVTGKDADRVTPVGKWLRKSSLDELPQLLNVIKGDMALVGPRPLISEYDDLYSVDQKKRFKVKPGITGLTQIKGRNALSWEERFQLDQWYVENRSFWLDLRIILKTPLAVFSGKGIFRDTEYSSEPFRGNE